MNIDEAPCTRNALISSPCANEKCDVYIDDEKYSFTTNIAFPLLAGKHHVRILIKD